MKWYTLLVSMVLVLVFITAADDYVNDGHDLLNSMEVTSSKSPFLAQIPTQAPLSYAVGLGEVPTFTAVNQFGQTTNADATATDVWQGATTTPIYVAPTQARVHNIASTDALDVLAAGTLTFAAGLTDGDTVTIASKVYTFEDVLTDVDGNVQNDPAQATALVNLVAAINLSAGAGTKYAASMTANAAPTSAVDGAGDTMTLYAQTAIATTETGAQLSWGAANAVLGTGAKTVTIKGLTTWSASETSETVNMTGVTDAATTGSYVFINSLEVATSGGTTINAGVITATAASDASVSASMPIGKGLAQQAIIAASSLDTIYIDQLHFTILGAGTTDIVDFSLLVNTEPNTQLTKFKEYFATGFVGTAMQSEDYITPIAIAGPCIVKIQALSDTADSHLAARLGGAVRVN